MMVRLVASREYYPLRSQVRLHLGANNLLGPAIPVVCWGGFWASDYLLMYQCSMLSMASDIESKISYWVLTSSKCARKVRLPLWWASRSANEVHCSYRAWGIPRIKKIKKNGLELKTIQRGKDEIWMEIESKFSIYIYTK